MKGLSRLVKILSEYGFIIAVVLIAVFLLFAAVNSSAPPEITPESVEMRPLR
ncbi:MAG: hypothetical protein ACR2RF_13665 [Geminicoccaceae bacterium]